MFLLDAFCVRRDVYRAVVAGVVLCAAVGAQTVAGLKPVAQVDRVPEGANFAAQMRMSGALPAWVRAENQVASQSVNLGETVHVSVVLQRDAAVEAAFEAMLKEQVTPGSAMYHRWLTPQQVGTLFGPTQHDVAAVSAWLTSQGLKVDAVTPDAMTVKAEGTVAAVGSAFRTSFGYFEVGGQARMSVISEPAIPAALAAVVGSVQGLTAVPLRPMSHRVTVTGAVSAKAGEAPQVNGTDANGNTVHFLGPNDFAAIYDIASVYSGGNKGATIGSAAQRVAIVGRSRVDTADITEFETQMALPTETPTVIVPTGATDPGTTGDGNQDEATLDVDRVIGTAPGAGVDLIVAKDTNTQSGVYEAASYNVNTQKDPVMSISFGACEAAAGLQNTNTWNSLFETAAAEGITVLVSSDDSGAAGCDTAFQPVTAGTVQTKSINYICASGYATCVGGTEFNDTASPSTYWSSTNGTGFESALSYIPEGGWNEPVTTNNSGATIYVPAASGGGVSVYITKPTWQTGTGVPADGFRDVPDVSLSASSHDGYFGCLAYAGGSCVPDSQHNFEFEVFSGTSAAAPGMAGIVALLNTKTGSAQGNVNPLLYRLAASTGTNPFHDATTASSGVTSCAAATPSMCNNSTPGSMGLTGGLAGYVLTTGYDQVTGLGSVDVANLFTAAVTPYVSTSLALTAAANPITVGQSTTFTATLTPASTPNGTPTGTVQFYSNGTAIGSPVTLTNDVATSASATFSTQGTDSISAVYSGDTTYETSTSSPLSLVVNSAGSFTLAANPTTLSVTPVENASGSATSAITLTSAGFAGNVALTCVVTLAGGGTATSAPGCTLSPPNVPLTAGGTGASTLTISYTGPTGGCLTSELRKPSPWSKEAPGAIALAGLLLMVMPVRRRKGMRALGLMCVLVVGLGSMTGCGGGTTTSVCSNVVASGTTAGTYTVTVTGTNGSLTATTATTAVTLTVTTN
jgi:pseudomonalisin